MEQYAGKRFIARSPLDARNKRAARLKALGHTVEMFDSAMELRTRVCGIMADHPELVCVVQNPPGRNDKFLPLGVLVHTPGEATVELSPYWPIDRAEDDWTPMVVWFVARDEDAHSSISINHQRPTPVVK